MSDCSTDYTLRDCPTPYEPWVEGMNLPEIGLTIPLKSDEDFTGAIVQMILTRDNSDPDNPDILEKTLIELANEPGHYWSGKVTWEDTDLIEGIGQRALFILTNSLGEKQALAQFNIDVLENTDPIP